MSLSPQTSSEWSPVRIDRAESRTVRAISNGLDYRVSISVPDAPAPSDGFPVLVVLDGGALFATAAETERRLSHRAEVTRVAPTLIVGVGPAGDGLYDAEQRRRDFTPSPDADAFMTFLLDQVLPIAAGKAPADLKRTALLGHSLAGYFALDVLTTRPDDFALYGAISPSIWWNPDRLLDAAPRLAGRGEHVLLAVGQLEQKDDEPNARRRDRRMVEAVQHLGAALAASLGPDHVEVHVFPDEDHASVVGTGIVRLLRKMGAGAF